MASHRAKPWPVPAAASAETTVRGEIVGILLAAGRGSRFGSDKLLHPLADGTPMAVAAAASLLQACGRVIAVLRPGWLVALADMPFIAPASHHAVATNLRAGASLAASEFAGRRGHPVGFAGKWRDQLAQLGGDQGGKSILDAHAQGLVLCRVDDPGVLCDIDRPEDLDTHHPRLGRFA